MKQNPDKGRAYFDFKNRPIGTAKPPPEPKVAREKTLADGVRCVLMEYGPNNYAIQMFDGEKLLEQMPVPVEAEAAYRLFGEQS